MKCCYYRVPEFTGQFESLAEPLFIVSTSHQPNFQIDPFMIDAVHAGKDTIFYIAIN